MLSRPGALARAGVLAAATTAVAATGAAAQYVEVPRPAAYALEGVTLVGADGSRQEGVTVVVRDRFIEDLGRNVAVPADAEVLEGEGLVVYPGLVDGMGKAEHAFPQPEIRREEVEIWDAPRSLQGFMPARRLAAFLTATGEDVVAQRREGIVAAAVHPQQAMMAGRGALLLYRKDAETPEALVIRPELGPRFTLQGGRGVYPGTLFGVVAFIRQAFEDARHRGVVRAAHERDPRGLTTPSYDADYDVLQRVLAGELPVYFEANDAADILRVVGLADEYGFRPVITGGAEAWKVADELRRRDIPVLVSVDFPEPRRWEPPEEGEPEEPLDAAAEREKREHEARWSNAARLAEAGVTFALTSGGSGEILEGARTAVEYGLAPDAALTALTTTPARLYDVPHLARLESGLPATFMVTTGPLFDEDSEVAYTFVEGMLEEGDEDDGAEAGDPAEAASFGGVWDTTVTSDGRTLDATMTIEQDGATFTGTLAWEGDMAGTVLRIRNGRLNGNALTAVAELEQEGETIEMRIEGTLEGETASGTADAGVLGTSRWTARRTSPGGGR